ncbi:LysM peptidoglycan-binding domain-containing protein [Paenibacillus soyae]|uniref:LysM peptidoglycan-binding domain-containing protein n=1 Tax=Paenibacillus soyae TaxID=2969249 RepID=A0A9X2MMZ2_9BACL|nr:LysM peptidoglycan-binding domain-containing protein [Paenibacillus soyae]
MSNGTNGLRFDVYERVHLPEDVAGIDELEEIELVPRIQVIDQGDQAVLKGQLLLSGVYRGQEGAAGPYALEHWIPVEISLPMNRVSKLDDISIEIDNFDVDLLSARTLNITGVLSLRGITVEPVREEQAAEWQEESFTAVHQREYQEINEVEQEIEEAPSNALSEAEPGQAEYAYSERAGEATSEEEHYISSVDSREAAQPDEEREITVSSRDQEEDGWIQLNLKGRENEPSTEAQPQEEQLNAQQGVSQLTSLYSQFQPPSAQPPSEREPAPIAEPAVAEASEPADQPEYRPEAAIEIQAEASQEQETEAAGEWELSQAASSLQQAAEPEPEPRKPQEVQIAFSGKRAIGSEEEQGGLGFRSILQSSRREQAARQAAEEIESQQAAEAKRDQTAEEEIEWKRLFLSKQSEENEFRKIRMCIVQREETLEQIALRYSLNPREILIHNGLHESSVAEGQLLYIPR